MSGERNPLPYARRDTTDVGSSRFVVLAIVNSVAALGTLWFVPLAIHIWSCGASEKWCHLQALLFGVPSAVVLGVLLMVTAAMTLTPAPRRAKVLKGIAWFALAIAVSVLVALFAAVVHDS